ncbi:MAG: glycerate kinase type-2 family protein [Nitrososphaeria archaeon]
MENEVNDVASRKILNWSEIADSEPKRIALEVVEEGLKASNPYSSVIETLSRTSDQVRAQGKIVVVGFGKASYQMALACEMFFGDKVDSGLIIAPKGSVKDVALKKIELLEGTHPVPTELNVESAKKILQLTRHLSPEDLVICLISGGGSALFTYPAHGITIQDKQEMTKLMLAAGLTIQEINCIRKHISEVKGGQLARHIYPARVISLILSDVVGDDLSSIASGPTSPDPYTYKDVMALFEKYHITEKVPENILARIRQGLEGKISDTPKPDDRIFSKITNIIVANNIKTLRSMAEKAESFGIKTMILTSYLEGEAREVGKVIGSIAKQVVDQGSPLKPPCAIFFGGETTVTLRGNGKGGRNQEMALSVALSINGLPKVTFVSVGSDGIDGNSDAAGAIIDGKTIEKAEEKGLPPIKYLENNDSNTFLRAVNSLIYTGLTGTNVNDLAFLLIL